MARALGGSPQILTNARALTTTGSRTPPRVAPRARGVIFTTANLHPDVDRITSLRRSDPDLRSPRAPSTLIVNELMLLATFLAS